MATVKPKKALESYWLENLCDSRSVFSNKTGGKFDLEPHGYVGSIVEVERKVAFDPYVKRAMARNKLGVLSEDEALTKMETLNIRPGLDDSRSDQMQRYLGEDVDKLSRYKRDNLPEFAEQRAVSDADQVWTGNTGPSQHAEHATRLVDPAGANPGRHEVSKNDDFDPALGPDHAIVDKPILDPKAVMTAPVKAGEWATETAPVVPPGE